MELRRTLGRRNRSKANHTVPEFFLRRFADERGLLRVFDKDAGIELPSPQSVTSLTVVNDFYTVAVDGLAPDQVERNVLANLEAQWAVALRELDERFPPDAATRANIADFVAFQYLRVPRWRKLAGQAIENRLAAGDAELRAEIIRRENQLRTQGVPNNGFVLMMLRAAIPLSDHLSSRPWVLGTVSDGLDLLTSDSPVRFSQRGSKRGIYQADVVFLSISRHSRLWLGPCSSSNEGVIEMTPGDVQEANEITLTTADRFVFAHLDSPADIFPV